MGETALKGMYGAVERGDADEVRRILADSPEKLTEFPGFASSWFHYAAAVGQTRVIDVFLEAGLEINWGRRDQDDTPLVASLRKGQYETAKYLLSRGANPNLGRCLIAALNSETNSFEMVKLLVENGVDVNHVWRFGDEERGPLITALSWALDSDQPEIAEYLRAHGAKMPPQEGKPAEQMSGGSARDEIIAWFEQEFGPVSPDALREIVPSDDHPVMIHRIDATDDRDSIILFTTGMSDVPMKVPEGEEEYRFAELLIELPKDWPLSKKALADAKRRWPVDWLRRVVAYVRDEETWLGGAIAIMANSDPPSPIAPGCRFTAMLLAAGYGDVGPIAVADGRQIQVYTLVPLYEDERELELSQGLPELFRRMDQFDVGRRIDLERPNVASRH